jgi:hypothetical protein
MYVMYYTSLLRCWQLVRILVRTDNPYLRVGCHSWYQSLMSIMTIVVLTCGKLTWIYFSHLLSVTMHRR